MIPGGLRARFLHDSFTQLVEDGLHDQGWFNPGRSHTPLTFLYEPVPWNQPVELNTLMVGTRNRETGFVELGTNLTTDTVAISIDFYADGDSIGIHLTNDIRDILRGRLGSGSHLGTFHVFDFNQATPVVIGAAHVAQVSTTRLPVRAGQEYTRHWYAVDTLVEDTYYSSEDLP